MNILVTGATGFVARNFVKYVTDNFHQVNFILLTRSPFTARNLYKNYKNCKIITELTSNLPAINIVLNLAGSPVMGGSFRFNSKELIWQSRIEYTLDLCQKLKELKNFPSVFINASATGIYGSSNEPITERTHKLGGDFFPSLALDWENSAWEGCKTTTARVALLRFGNIIGNDGGMFPEFRKLYKLGLTCKIGRGNQFMPWISIDDTVRAIVYTMTHKTCQGAINICSPVKVTHHEFCTLLAKAMNKQVRFKVPEWLLSFVKGDVAKIVTMNQIVIPQRLIREGFTFNDENLEDLFKKLLNPPKKTSDANNKKS